MDLFGHINYQYNILISVCRGKRRSTGGFVWRYEDEDNMPVAFDGIGRQHTNFPNYYVKTDARIYSMITNRYLKPKKHKSGYLSIGLSNNGIKRDFYLHVLVAQLYLTPDPYRQFVNHLNMVKTDNDIDNLEWCTASENIIHAIDNSSFNHIKGVSQYTMDGIFIMSFASIRLANIVTDIDNSSIVRCCKGKAGHAGGYKWKYTI